MLLEELETWQDSLDAAEVKHRILTGEEEVIEWEEAEVESDAASA